MCLIVWGSISGTSIEKSLLIFFFFLRKIVAEYEKTIAQMIGKDFFYVCVWCEP